MFPNTWLTCTKNPYRISGKLKDHMKLTSMINSMRLQLQERSLRKLRCQTWRLQTTWTWRTQSSNITRMMRLKPWVGSLYTLRCYSLGMWHIDLIWSIVYVIVICDNSVIVIYIVILYHHLYTLRCYSLGMWHITRMIFE
jgi:hypothetical protein